MMRKIMLKYKIRRIVNMVKKCDIDTQKECVGIIKRILYEHCKSDKERESFIIFVYRVFRKRGLL